MGQGESEVARASSTTEGVAIAVLDLLGGRERVVIELRRRLECSGHVALDLSGGATQKGKAAVGARLSLRL